MRNWIFIIFSFLTLVSHAQESGTPIVIGTNHFIESKNLGETRQIQVALPPGYEESDQKYPVLYVLDGQQYFAHAVSLSSTFRHFGVTPEFIIVGIHTPYPQRYRQFSAGKESFMSFLEEEVMTFVDSAFRTKNESLIFGWQYAGSLGFEILLSKPGLFNSYLLASPFPLESRVDALDGISDLDNNLYFAVSPYEYQVNHGTNKLDSLLSAKTIDGLEWKYIEFSEEEHRSTAYTMLYHGLRAHFQYFPEYHVTDLQVFLEAGGIDEARRFSEERSRLYGTSPEIPTWSKYTIIRSAIRANDYEHFRRFTDEFVEEAFIRDLKNRSIEIADYFEANDQLQEAIDIYEFLLKDQQDSERILNRVGNAYAASGKPEEAEKYFQRARKLKNDSN